MVTMECAEQGQLGRVAPMFTSRGGHRSFTCLLEPGTVRVQRPTATSFAGVNLDISFTGDILGRALSTGSSSVATSCVSCALRYHELPSRLDSRGHTQPGCGTTVTARLSRKMRDGTSCGSQRATSKPVISTPASFHQIASGNDIVVMLRADGNMVTMECAEQGQLGRVAPMFTSRGGHRSFTCLLEPGTVRVQRPTATSFAGVNLDISFTGDILGRALSTGSSSVATSCVSWATHSLGVGQP
ncbi:hypothetical protein V5799_002339 [Amblyomma americanum]|uniref:Uncharacterized protein n=1 Tax=Amblyomma americanum TaxID=6943 RepID=A0AAQ4CXL9_AMBAM